MSGSRAQPNAEELERIVADDRKEVMHKKMAAQAADLERSRAAKAAQQAAPPSLPLPSAPQPFLHRPFAAITAISLSLPPHSHCHPRLGPAQAGSELVQFKARFDAELRDAGGALQAAPDGADAQAALAECAKQVEALHGVMSHDVQYKVTSHAVHQLFLTLTLTLTLTRSRATPCTSSPLRC